jgi:4-alpha-glucanotransferase
MDGVAEGQTPVIPADCLASINTHDMPTFAAMWQALDIGQQKQVGLLKPRQAPAAFRKRTAALHKLVGILATVCPDITKAKGVETVLRCTLGWLGASRARGVMVNIEDLWLETAQQNIPGVGSVYPSWRHRTAVTMDQLKRESRVADALQMLRALTRRLCPKAGGKQACHTK